MKYVYCIIRDNLTLPASFPSGLGNASVYKVCFDSIVALVSDAVPNAVDNNIQNVIAHQEIVKSVSGPSSSIIPCRFGALFQSDNDIIALLEKHHDIIDKEPHIYTADILHQMKKAHETKGRKEILPEDSIFAGLLLNDYRKIIIHNNKGNIVIDSPGAIQANAVTIKTHKKNIKILPPTGTISSDLRMRGYVKHLIDRYNDFAGSDPTRKSDFFYGSIYGSIKKTFKVKWDFIPVGRFEELVEYLQKRIDKTRQANINKGKGYKSYSSFSDYCSDLMKGTSPE